MLTTRCSACSTEFRVTEQQLAARNGWVRCGQCMAVFDARRALVVPLAEANTPPVPAPGAFGDPADAPGGRAERSDAASDPGDVSRDYDTDASREARLNLDISAGSGIDLLASSALEPDASHHGFANSTSASGPDAERRPIQEKNPDSGIQAAPHPASGPASRFESTFEILPEPEEAEDTAKDPTEPYIGDADGKRADAPGADADQFDAHPAYAIEAVDTPLEAPGADAGPAPLTAASPIAEVTPAATGPATASAKDDPDVLDFGPKPHKRRTALWIGGSAALLLALGAQAAFQYRGTIALLLPETKPYLEEFCASLGCELPLPRRAELLSIETSDLQGHPNNPGVMVLAATLRNRAPFPQAYPALELTLTDDRDQPLARRVLQPSDYLGQNASRAEARVFAPSSEQPVRVFIEASALKATGYRLYLFHP